MQGAIVGILHIPHIVRFNFDPTIPSFTRNARISYALNHSRKIIKGKKDKTKSHCIFKERNKKLLGIFCHFLVFKITYMIQRWIKARTFIATAFWIQESSGQDWQWFQANLKNALK